MGAVNRCNKEWVEAGVKTCFWFGQDSSSITPSSFSWHLTWSRQTVIIISLSSKPDRQGFIYYQANECLVSAHVSHATGDWNLKWASQNCCKSKALPTADIVEHVGVMTIMVWQPWLNVCAHVAKLVKHMFLGSSRRNMTFNTRLSSRARGLSETRSLENLSDGSLGSFNSWWFVLRRVDGLGSFHSQMSFGQNKVPSSCQRNPKVVKIRCKANIPFFRSLFRLKSQKKKSYDPSLKITTFSPWFAHRKLKNWNDENLLKTRWMTEIALSMSCHWQTDDFPSLYYVSVSLNQADPTWLDSIFLQKFQSVGPWVQLPSTASLLFTQKSSRHSGKTDPSPLGSKTVGPKQMATLPDQRARSSRVTVIAVLVLSRCQIMPIFIGIITSCLRLEVLWHHHLSIWMKEENSWFVEHL